MAISEVASASNHIGSSGSLVVSVPAGTQNGDVMLAEVILNGNSQTAPAPTGWTQLDSSGSGGGPTSISFYRVASSEPASYTWTCSAAANGQIITYRGVDNTSPINAHGAWNRVTSSTTVTASSVTTSVAAMLVMLVGVASSEVSGWTKPTGWTDRGIVSSTVSSALAELQQGASGATGSVSATISLSANSNASIVALKPAGGTAYTLSATAGSVSVTGDTAGTPVARTLSGTSATVAATGAAASVPVGRKLAALPGSFSVTGDAATAPVSRILGGSPTTVVVTGAAATLPVARALTASPASVVITGIAATLTYSPAGGTAYTLSAAPGASSITGTTASIPVRRVVSASAASFSITGTTAKLPVGRVIATTPAVILVTGFQATFIPAPPVVATAGGDDWAPAYMLAAAMVQQKLLAPMPKRQLVLLNDEAAPVEMDDVWAAILALVAAED